MGATYADLATRYEMDVETVKQIEQEGKKKGWSLESLQ
jgi:hypothetical protein